MADEEEKDIAVDSDEPKKPPAFRDMAKNVAKKVMQHIRDNPRQGYGGTAGVSMEDAGMAGELLDNTAEAREFAESPGVGTGAMAAMGLTGFPAREMKAGAKALTRFTKEQLTKLDPAIRERHLFDQILGELNGLKKTIHDADHNTLRMDYDMPPMSRGDRGQAGQLRGNLRANPDHPIVQRYHEVRKQLAEQGKKYRETPGFYEVEGAHQNMSADDFRHNYFTDFDTGKLLDDAPNHPFLF